MIIRHSLLFLIFISLFFIVNGNSYSGKNDSIDSLLQVLKNTKTDTARVNLYNNLIGAYWKTDTVKALDYYKKALGLSKDILYMRGTADAYRKYAFYLRNTGNMESSFEYFSKAANVYDRAMQLERSQSGKKWFLIRIADCNNNIGLYYRGKANYPRAIAYYQKALKISKEIPDTSGIALNFRCIGVVHYYQGEYPQAIHYYLKSLKMIEKLDDKYAIAGCYNNIGIVHWIQGNFEQAIDYYKKSLQISEKMGDKRGIAGCYDNIGLVYADQGNYVRALEYSMKSLTIFIEFGDKKEISKCYNNMGEIYFYSGNYPKAIEHFQKSMLLRKELGDKAGESLVLSNMAQYSIKFKKYNEAIKFAGKGLAIAKEIGSLKDEKNAYVNLSAAYDSLGRSNEALRYYKLLTQTNDSLFNEQKHKQLAEMEAIYQSEKKQQEIEILNKDKALQKTDLKRQTTLKYAFISGFVLMLLLAIIIFLNYRQKKKANIELHRLNEEILSQKNEIEEKNEELQQQNEEIAAQRDEIETQRDLVVRQKEQIEKIHAEQTSSIRYAQRIQNAVLPTKDYISMQITSSSSGGSIKYFEHFVLYKPKDIVSGDFYWTEKKDHSLLIAVADCTGHGVPGAFMSMLGIACLNEIVAQKPVFSAGAILDELREYIIHSLQQKGTAGEQKDGMDVALIIIDTATNTLQFAGANNPVYIVSEGQLTEIKGNKMPVAIHEHMEPFTNHTIKINAGDIIYLTTDGYIDQFGGREGKKFMAKNFKKLLFENSNKPMEDQKDKLDNAIEEWKNYPDTIYEQTDDITVMAIKMKDYAEILTEQRLSGISEPKFR